MESTNKGIPLEGNHSPFSSWGNIGSPYVATLSLPGITIGLPVWIFSTSVVQNTVIPLQSNQHLFDTKVDPSPSSSFVSPPLLPLRLVKIVILVIRWLRRRREGRRRRRISQFSKGSTMNHLVKICTLDLLNPNFLV